MLRRLCRFALAAAGAGVVLWAGRRALIRWIDGPSKEPSTAPWEPVAVPADERDAPGGEAGAASTTAPEGPPADRDTPAADTATDNTAADDTPAAGTPADDAAGVAWKPPGETGTPPEGHPVKAKLSSRVYHLPGMSAYGRTIPDRCYASAEAAEADGFRRAKR